MSTEMVPNINFDQDERSGDGNTIDQIVDSESQDAEMQMINTREDLLDNYKELMRQEMVKITAHRQRIQELCPQIMPDLPTANFDDVVMENNMIWEEANPSQRNAFYLSYMKNITLEHSRIVNQAQALKNKKSLFMEGTDFDGSYIRCVHLNASLNSIVKKHLYDIIQPEIPQRQTMRRTVRHSIDYVVMNFDLDWRARLGFLAKYSGLREESCFSTGRAPGSVILELDANVREAYPRDVVSVVNPYTGEKVVHEETHKDAIPPEVYFSQNNDFKKGLHNYSDELFCRFDINKDLKRVLVDDVKLLSEVRLILDQNGLVNVPVEFMGENETEESSVEG